MSDWKKIESRYGKEIEEIKQQVKDYEYSDKKGVKTDEALRALLVEKLKKAKDKVSEIHELAYREGENLTDVRLLKDEIDISLNEIKKSRFANFKKDKLETLVNHDAVLIKNTNTIKEAVENLHTNILNSKVENLQREAQIIKAALKELREIFSDRERLLR